MSAKPEPLPEFSRPIPRHRLAGRVIVEEIAATPEERAALARRFGLLGLDLLAATLRIEPGEAKGSIRLDGHLSAEVSQACVVTLEQVASRIEEDFTRLYSLEPGPAPAAEVVVDPEAEEPPEALGPGGLDMGEAVAEQLAVALEPYPRAPGAALPELHDATGAAESAETGARGAFEVLEALKRHE
jgi:uncharacterized metal-binding protein YceD (DUF177 family)